MQGNTHRWRIRAAQIPSVRRVPVQAFALALALSGCAVGPDFREPTLPATAAYQKGTLPSATVATNAPTGDAQRFIEGADVPARWWTTFANDELDRRIEQALEHSPSIASAQAALRQAQENTHVARGSLWPRIDATASATRGNANSFTAAGEGLSSIFSVYNAGVEIGYTLDLFGGVRRGVEAQSAFADFRQFQLQGTYLSLAANVVTASFREAALRGQIRAIEDIVDAYGKQLELVESQSEIGAKSLADVLIIRTQVATTRAQLPALRQQLAQTQTQLSVYLGRFPSEADFAALELDALTLPHDVPVSVPSALTRQRPDIRAAEAQLHQATAGVGVATANLFPQITLGGSLGKQGVDAQNLFGGGATEAWSIGANLLQPVFNAGSLRAHKRAAEAGLEQAAADYRTTLLTAFQNVADSLYALELDAENLQAQAQAEQSAQRSLDLVRTQYDEGAASYLHVLDATRQYEQARIGLILARADRLADTAALYVALGGSWHGEPTAALPGSDDQNESN